MDRRAARTARSRWRDDRSMDGSFSNVEDGMKQHTMTLLAAWSVALAVGVSTGAAAQSWTGVEQALGRTGAVQPGGGIIRFSFPRRDLHVTVGNVEVKPRSEPDPKKAELVPVADAAKIIADRVLAEIS